MVVEVYTQWDDIDVYFPEYNWTAKHMEYSQFKKGQVKCPYEPRVCNIGYIGEGMYSHKSHPNHYEHWRAMLNRCTGNKEAYRDCIVNNEWLNFQNFAKWFDEHYYEVVNETMCLDKDILVKNNKEYGPNTCCFVPNNINVLFTKRKNYRGEYPIGIKSKKSNGKYEVSCSIAKSNNKERTYLGVYETIEEAFNVYKEYKENYIKRIADEYSSYIPEYIYNALYNYEVDWND